MNRVLSFSKPAPRPTFQWRVLLTILGCIVSVALISRFVLINNSLRLDEAQSLWQTSHSPGGLLRVVAQDVHVPGYHILLHFWQLYFGNGVQTARLMSLLLFMINIPVFYLMVRRLLSVNWSLFAVALFSFSPFMNWYANEARMYTLLALMATISQYYYLRILQSDKPKTSNWVGYGLSALFGIYSHYFFLFNLAVQGIFYLLNFKRFAPGSFKRLAIVGIMVVVALSPWLLYFHSLGSGKNTSPQLVTPSSVDLFNALSQFSFGFQNDHINTILLSLWPIMVVVALLAVRRKQSLSLSMSYILTASLLPVLLAFGLSFAVKPFFISRYMISCMPPLIIMAVWFISNYKRKLAAIAAAAFSIIILLTSLNQAGDKLTPVKENYQAIASRLNIAASPSDAVVLSSPFTIYPFEYYYHGRASLNTLPDWDRRSTGGIPAFNAKTLPAQVTSLNQGHRYIYLVLSYNQGYASTIHNYYANHFRQVESTVYSHDLALYVYQVGYDVAPRLSALPASDMVKPDVEVSKPAASATENQ
jgi:mannosyltransferase